MVEKTKAGKVTKTQWLEISKDSKPEEWEYYTEGKEHVVCRYKGQNMKYTQFILRIQKMTQLKIAECNVPDTYIYYIYIYIFAYLYLSISGDRAAIVSEIIY